MTSAATSSVVRRTTDHDDDESAEESTVHLRKDTWESGTSSLTPARPRNKSEGMTLHGYGATPSGVPPHGTGTEDVPRFAACARNASKIYGTGEAEVRALDDLTLELPRGQFTAIMGPSGSGKSTLLHCMAGLDTLTSGHVLIGDTDLATLTDRQLTLLRRDRLGFVFQSFNLLPMLTAEENITLPEDLAGRTPDPAWFATVVDKLNIRDRLSHRPPELSGGQQQRVAIGRALIVRPEVVFADEPTGALDSRASAELLRFLRSVVDDLGQTVVMVTHDPGAAAYADRVVFLTDGRIVEELAHPDREKVLEIMGRLGG